MTTRLVFAVSGTYLSFDARRDIATRVSADKRLRKLGLTSVCWLGALRMSVHFTRELTAKQHARVVEAVRAARDANVLAAA